MSQVKRPIRVLLIEDSENDATLMLLELRKAGYEVISKRVQTADTMAAALAGERWDIVIADYVLPTFSGPAALKLLQAQGLDLPFIIVSGHIDEDTAVASMKAGAHDYIMKDRLTRLVPAIERELVEAEVRRARRRSETEFAQEQTLRLTIEDSIPSGIAAFDTEGTHTYVNPAFCNLVGWSETELLGMRPPYAYWPAGDVDAMQTAINRFVEAKAPVSGLEMSYRHRSGKVFDVLLLINPLKGSQGTVVGWLSSVTDITERKRAEQRLRVQYAIARELSQAVSLKAASAQVLQVIAESTGWQAGRLWRTRGPKAGLDCVGFWQDDTKKLAKALEPAPQKGPAKESLPDRVLAGKEPVFETVQFGEKTADETVNHKCGFPIHSGAAILGVLEFLYSSSHEPDESLQLWMAAIGNQIGQFMVRQSAEEALRSAHAELENRVRERTADLMTANLQLEKLMQDRKRLEHELLEITEKERRRIGLDLHDDLGQKLAGLSLMMKGLEVGLERKKLSEAVEARKIHGLIEQTVRHAGTLARDLALADLAESDLPTALKALATNVEKLFDISCVFKCEGKIQALDGAAITQFYKITQEAVTNAVKHGKAARVNIDLVQEPGRLVLTIKNNGLPFPSMISQSKGMGLRIMKYRANVVGAVLEVKSARPKGTVVECILPGPAKTAQRVKHSQPVVT